jgi:hypothetical protein
LVLMSILNSIGVTGVGLVLFVILLLAFGLRSQAVGPYLDKCSTEMVMVFVRPWHLSACILSGAMALACGGLGGVLPPHPFPSLTGGVTLLMICTLFAALLLIVSYPYSLKLDLNNGVYVRRSGWVPLTTRGFITEIIGVAVERITTKAGTIFFCKLIWATNKKLIIGQFRELKDAEQFARLMSEKLRVPIDNSDGAT